MYNIQYANLKQKSPLETGIYEWLVSFCAKKSPQIYC